MVLVCAAAFCKSDSKTLINGEKVHFFSFPTDPDLKEQWDRACNTSAKFVMQQKSPRVICHLHFHKHNFESINKLRPDAVPIIHVKKRKLLDKEEAKSKSNDIKTKRSKLSLSEMNNEPKTNSEDSSVQSDSSNEIKVQPFRLTIKIEKIFKRPSPMSKKNNQTNGKIDNGMLSDLSNEQHTVVKNEDQYSCLVCKEEFKTISELHKHLKDHFTCDICRMEFSSQKSHKNHYEIHQSKNERFPYKCHVCSALFEKKDYIKTHNHIKNMAKFESADENRIQYCKSCHLTFRDEPTFRKHLSSHVESAALKNPLMGL